MIPFIVHIKMIQFVNAHAEWQCKNHSADVNEKRLS